MEEKQIQDFIHQIVTDEKIRRELAGDAVGVITRQGLSPRVAEIIFRLIPHLSFESSLDSNEKWWHA